MDEGEQEDIAVARVIGAEQDATGGDRADDGDLADEQPDQPAGRLGDEARKLADKHAASMDRIRRKATPLRT